MTYTWKLNEAHDLQVRHGSIGVVYGADEVRQRIAIALQHYWQEYFLNVQDGVPWYEVLLGTKSKKTVEAIIRRNILDVPGVVGISYLNIIKTGRDWAISTTVEIYTGEVVNISLEGEM